MIEDPRFKRQENESEEDYEFRVDGLKEELKLTWEDIAQILNKELDYEYSESRYRRRYAAYIAGYRKRDGEIQDGKSLGDLTLSDEEKALKMSYGFKSGKLDYYRLLRQEGRFERFYALVAQSLKTLQPPSIVPMTPRKELVPKEYLLTIADTHIGSCFEGINNSYSIEEARRRFGKLLTEVTEFVRARDITHLKILSLGDLIQGILRISDLRLNQMAIVDAFVLACRMYADFLNELSAYCKIEFLQVCYSNHDQLRPLGTKASELGSEDMGKIFFAYLTDTLKENDRIKIIGDTSKDYLQFNIFTFKCFALHGHQVKAAANLYRDLATRHHEFFDYIFVGHTHSTKEFVNAECATYDAETLVSGSFCGSDPYADKLMVGSKASCKIYEFEPQRGHTASYKIILN